MPASAGLQTNLTTWLVVTGLAACWLLSVRLVPGWKQSGWPAVLKSLYGIVWLGFGLDIVLRFLMLSYNAVEWANGSSRLLAETAETVNRSLGYCGLYWTGVALAYWIAARRRGPGPLGIVRMFTVDRSGERRV